MKLFKLQGMLIIKFKIIGGFSSLDSILFLKLCLFYYNLAKCIYYINSYVWYFMVFKKLNHYGTTPTLKWDQFGTF